MGMNPGSGEKARFEAPQPSVEAPEQAAEQGVESQPAYIEKAPSAQPSPPSIALPTDIPTAMPVNIGDDADSSTAPDASGEAVDRNKIEKQWVDKAKTVIAQTKDDPYAQKKEISKVKADYIKTRFNKILRTDPGVS